MSGAYVEALQYRLPIVTTDRDFARAACGAAGRYFEAGDVEGAIGQLWLAAEAALGRTGAATEVSKPRPWSDVCGDLTAILDSIRRREHWYPASRGSKDLSGCRS